ncbi:AGAP007757-PA-like protein [Anopheles sinensis]|uniref:Gustatory receptor n=1 Tax=Anopheles sinensis TaxID=74873 RepID=A0A084W7M6_ANOSI|nr:AGAP007757-PA-like protein [Anopheles sinensis]
MARRRWQLDLQTALIPLYVVSKFCCVNAYTYRWLSLRNAPSSVRSAGNTGKTVETNLNPPSHVAVTLTDAFVDGSQHPDDPQGKESSSSSSSPSSSPCAMLSFSALGILHAVGCSVGYATYHTVSTLTQTSRFTDPNLVRVAISLKNQYTGCIMVLALVGLSALKQPTLDALLRTLLRVDEQLATIRTGLPSRLQTPTVNNNTVWLRNVVLMLVVGVSVKAYLERKNCLMYIRDSGAPWYYYCLVLCFVPQTLFVVCQLQSVAYALLLRDRFAQLNHWLRQLQPYLARGSGTAFWSLGRIAATHGELVKAVRLLNDTFGVQNAILLLNQFVTLVELGYNTCMMIVRPSEDGSPQDSLDDFHETLTWVAWFVLEIFVLCYFSHVTVDEAQSTASLLRLPTAYDVEQGRHFRMVSLEHMNLMSRKISITSGDLYDIDMSLFYAIIGATSTYLIILIQFDQSFNQ